MTNDTTPRAPYIDCDSPKLCAVHGTCAGQYGTQSSCKPIRAACEGAGSIPSEAEECEAFARWYDKLRASEINIDNSVEWLAWKARAALAVPSEGAVPMLSITAVGGPLKCSTCGIDLPFGPLEGKK